MGELENSINTALSIFADFNKHYLDLHEAMSKLYIEQHGKTGGAAKSENKKSLLADFDKMKFPNLKQVSVDILTKVNKKDYFTSSNPKNIFNLRGDLRILINAYAEITSEGDKADNGDYSRANLTFAQAMIKKGYKEIGNNGNKMDYLAEQEKQGKSAFKDGIITICELINEKVR